MSKDILSSVLFSARASLRGQTPDCLLAYSVGVEPEHRLIRLRAHVSRPPTNWERDELGDVETEVLADFHWDFETETEIDVVPPGAEPTPLPGGFAWRRDDG